MLVLDNCRCPECRVKLAIAEERTRCVQIVEDWYTIAPKYRTKETLLNHFREVPHYVDPDQL